MGIKPIKLGNWNQRSAITLLTIGVAIETKNKPKAIGKTDLRAQTTALENNSPSVFINSQVEPKTQYSAGKHKEIKIENIEIH